MKGLKILKIIILSLCVISAKNIAVVAMSDMSGAAPIIGSQITPQKEDKKDKNEIIPPEEDENKNEIILPPEGDKNKNENENEKNLSTTLQYELEDEEMEKMKEKEESLKKSNIIDLERMKKENPNKNKFISTKQFEFSAAEIIETFKDLIDRFRHSNKLGSCEFFDKQIKYYNKKLLEKNKKCHSKQDYIYAKTYLNNWEKIYKAFHKLNDYFKYVKELEQEYKINKSLQTFVPKEIIQKFQNNYGFFKNLKLKEKKFQETLQKYVDHMEKIFKNQKNLKYYTHKEEAAIKIVDFFYDQFQDAKIKYEAEELPPAYTTTLFEFYADSVDRMRNYTKVSHILDGIYEHYFFDKFEELKEYKNLITNVYQKLKSIKSEINTAKKNKDKPINNDYPNLIDIEHEEFMEKINELLSRFESDYKETKMIEELFSKTVKNMGDVVLKSSFYDSDEDKWKKKIKEQISNHWETFQLSTGATYKEALAALNSNFEELGIKTDNEVADKANYFKTIKEVLDFFIPLHEDILKHTAIPLQHFPINKKPLLTCLTQNAMITKIREIKNSLNTEIKEKIDQQDIAKESRQMEVNAIIDLKLEQAEITSNFFSKVLKAIDGYITPQINLWKKTANANKIEYNDKTYKKIKNFLESTTKFFNFKYLEEKFGDETRNYLYSTVEDMTNEQKEKYKPQMKEYDNIYTKKKNTDANINTLKNIIDTIDKAHYQKTQKQLQEKEAEIKMKEKEEDHKKRFEQFRNENKILFNKPNEKEDNLNEIKEDNLNEIKEDNLNEIKEDNLNEIKEDNLNKIKEKKKIKKRKKNK